MSTNTRTKFNLRKAILYAEGLDYPITGGTGLYPDDPIIITETHHPSAVRYENSIAEYASFFYKFWYPKIGRTALRSENGRKYDVTTIICEDDDSKECEVQLYFDITIPFTNVGKMLEEVKTPKELKDMENTPFVRKKPVPRFYEAVMWVLSSDVQIDKSAIMDRLEISDKDAKTLEKALKDCGALDNTSRGLLNGYNFGRSTQRKANQITEAEVVQEFVNYYIESLLEAMKAVTDLINESPAIPRKIETFEDQIIIAKWLLGMQYLPVMNLFEQPRRKYFITESLNQIVNEFRPFLVGSRVKLQINHNDELISDVTELIRKYPKSDDKLTRNTNWLFTKLYGNDPVKDPPLHLALTAFIQTYSFKWNVLKEDFEII